MKKLVFILLLSMSLNGYTEVNVIDSTKTTTERVIKDGIVYIVKIVEVDGKKYAYTYDLTGKLISVEVVTN